MEFRALRPDELETWLDHVTTVFSGGREYFSNHWHNDPWRDAEGIRVALDNGTIVSTVRVFLRKMFLQGETIPVGGIGEVSTHPEYRRRGIATQLLKDAVQFMESRGILISSLHGSQRIYSIEGWESVPRYIAKHPIHAKENTDWEIRPANFDDTAEVQRIAALYEGYARKFNGTFVRDATEYWTAWVRTESPSAWVAERNGNIEGYVSVASRDDRISVKEFSTSEAVFTEDRGVQLFTDMLGYLIAQKEAAVLEVEYPAPIAAGYAASVVTAHGSAMYRIVRPDALAEKLGAAPPLQIANLLHAQPKPSSQDSQSHHVFWTTDGF